MTDIKTVWKNQPMEENSMITLSDIRVRADRFQFRIRLRNGALYLYSLANIALTLWLISRGVSPRYTAPGLLLLAAHLFVIWQLWWRTSARALPDDLVARAALDYHRQELERQRGAMAIIMPFALIAALAFGAFAVDLGHVFLARTELQTAADASALTGAGTLLAGGSTPNWSSASASAATAMSLNSSDGVTLKNA